MKTRAKKQNFEVLLHKGQLIRTAKGGEVAGEIKKTGHEGEGGIQRGTGRADSGWD